MATSALGRRAAAGGAVVAGAGVGAVLLARRTGSARSRPVFARWYGVLSRRAEQGELGRRREGLLARGAGRVLDVGAGTGESFRHLPSAVTAVVALEPDRVMVRQARRRLSEARAPALLVRGAAEALPFREAAFDTAVTTLVLCTVDDPRVAAAELHRVLRPDGRLLVMEHVRAEDELLASWQDRVQRAWSWVNGGCRPNRPTLATLRDAGFRLENMEVYGFPVLPHAQGVAVASRHRGPAAHSSETVSN